MKIANFKKHRRKTANFQLPIYILQSRFFVKMEAAIGFEPMNEGFADLCLSHLATPPVFRSFGVGSNELGVNL
jgi:hypothetical protein